LVREQAAPEIAKLASEDKTAAAFPLIQTAERILPDDPALVHAVNDATRVVSLTSTPPGADVEVKDYLDRQKDWLRLGTTPLEKVRVPSGYLRWRVSKAGVGESITAPPPDDSMAFDLARTASAPDGMVPVDGGRAAGYFAFLGALGPYELPPFFVDQVEVTNRAYQEFVDQGGYANRDYWKQPFTRDGRELAWTDAMDLFRDNTGLPGPPTLEAGHYP
jgi:eukaryotic-like serine/threonine-protein kinase